jgi:hypothetical protein
MHHVQRFRAVMSGQPVDRLPVWEWAMWWDETVIRWRQEGLSTELGDDVFAIHEHLGLDPYKQFWFSTTEATIDAKQHHVEGCVTDMDSYLRLRPTLFPAHQQAIESMAPWGVRQAAGEAVVWATFEGPFWFTRTLLGFEGLMLAYQDQPELIHRISSDLIDSNLRLLERMSGVCVPTFVTIAEDMSYNHGPMISQRVFEAFIAPCYQRLIPRLKELGIIVIVDTDGDVSRMVPWLQKTGVDGVLPLERQAGVDGMNLRRTHPDLCMIGHFNKMTMPLGEEAMRQEFERLTPLVRSGRFIPSVDHQTPPGVSLEQYRCYLRLLGEYARTWVR